MCQSKDRSTLRTQTDASESTNDRFSQVIKGEGKYFSLELSEVNTYYFKTRKPENPCFLLWEYKPVRVIQTLWFSEFGGM